ncbi:UNVERIFIED_CONTAM: hypothetical protein GTU68_041155 [Idotea baltica]|nr:hypothetical protein [Idotea baltica]
MLAFIMPATFHMFIFKNRLTKKQRYFDLLRSSWAWASIIGLWDAFDRISEQPLVVDELAQSHLHSKVASIRSNISSTILNATLSMDAAIKNSSHSWTVSNQRHWEDKVDRVRDAWIAPATPESKIIKSNASEVALSPSPSTSKASLTSPDEGREARLNGSSESRPLSEVYPTPNVKLRDLQTKALPSSTVPSGDEKGH